MRDVRGPREHGHRRREVVAPLEPEVLQRGRGVCQPLQADPGRAVPRRNVVGDVHVL